MTIHEHDRLPTGDDADRVTAHAGGPAERREPYAVAFGGQGASSWLASLEELVTTAGIRSGSPGSPARPNCCWNRSPTNLWSCGPSGSSRCAGSALAAEGTGAHHRPAHVGGVAARVLLTQIAAIRALDRRGTDFAAAPPVAMAGHSQGVLAVEALRAGGARDVEMLALSQLIGAAGTLVAQRRGITALGDRTRWCR